MTAKNDIIIGNFFKRKKNMSEDLQSLLEKINRDGVEKAKAEAARIIAEAKAKADALVKSAAEEAERAKADAKKAAEDYTARAEETIGQAARDTVLKVKASVSALLENALAKDVDRALSDEKTVTALVADAIKGLVGPVEVAVNPKLAAALKAQLAAQGSVTVVTDEDIGAGFSVKTDGGRVEHTFTEDAIAAEIAKRLRPELAKLVK
jgi:V/A-type H+-transporting ATPase subunit E